MRMLGTVRFITGAAFLAISKSSSQLTFEAIAKLRKDSMDVLDGLLELEDFEAYLEKHARGKRLGRKVEVTVEDEMAYYASLRKVGTPASVMTRLRSALRGFRCIHEIAFPRWGDPRGARPFHSDPSETSKPQDDGQGGFVRLGTHAIPIDLVSPRPKPLRSHTA